MALVVSTDLHPVMADIATSKTAAAINILVVIRLSLRMELPSGNMATLGVTPCLRNITSDPPPAPDTNTQQTFSCLPIHG
jgi:hypothetical protein